MAEPPRDYSRFLIRYEGMRHDEQLFRAIKSNNLARVEEMLLAGASIHSFNDKGLPVFVDANSEDMFRLLFSWGLKIDAPIFNNGTTLLHSVACSQTSEEVKLLLSLGADVNARDNGMETPLFCAVTARSLETIRELAKWSADLNAQKADGQTALHVAINGYDLVTANELIDLGARVDVFDDEGNSIIGYVAMFYNKSFRGLAERLIDIGVDVNVTKRDDNFTPLHFACFHNNGDLVTMLFAAGADSNALTNEGESPLDVALRRDAHDAVTSLNQNDSNPR